MQQPPSSSQGPIMAAPYHKEYSWISHARPKAEADEQVIEVRPGPPLRPLQIPLHPVSLDEEGNISAKDQQIVPWELIEVYVGFWPSKVSEKEEAAAVQSAEAECAHSGLKRTVEGRSSSFESVGTRAHTKAILYSATTPTYTVQSDPRIKRTNQTMPMGQSMQVCNEPIQFTIPCLGLRKETATSSKVQQQHQENSSAISVSESDVQGNASSTYRPTAQSWLKHSVPIREIYIPRKGSVLHTSFLLQTQDMFHFAHKHLSATDLYYGLKSIRSVTKKQYDIHDTKRFVYRGNICQLCTRCKNEDCAWNYTCTTCFFPQPVCERLSLIQCHNDIMLCFRK